MLVKPAVSISQNDMIDFRLTEVDRSMGELLN